MDIKALQGDFIEGIFGGDQLIAESHVMGDDILTAKQRFGIYKGSVHGILTQALGTMFPVCKTLVGDEFFDQLCGMFINEHPPKTSFFSEYGSELAGFLDNFEHVKDIPYFPDVARLEWARQTVWHSVENQNSDFSSLAELDEDQQTNVVFQLASNVRLLESKFRIDELWFAHQGDSEIALENIDINHPVKLIVRKDQGIIKISVMNENENDSNFWGFLNAISLRHNLEDLADQFGETLPAYLNQSIEGAWVQSFTT